MPDSSTWFFFRWVLWPQIEADALVDEAQRVALAIINIGADHAGAHHLVKKARDPRVVHCADAVPQRVAGIDDAVLLHLGDGIGEQFVGHSGLSFLIIALPGALSP